MITRTQRHTFLFRRFERAFGTEYAHSPRGARMFALAWQIMLTGDHVVMTTIDGHRFVGNHYPTCVPKQFTVPLVHC